MNGEEKFDEIVSYIIKYGMKQERRFENMYKLHLKKAVYLEYRDGFQSLMLCQGDGLYEYESGYRGECIDYIGDAVLFHNITTPHMDVYHQKVIEKYDKTQR